MVDPLEVFVDKLLQIRPRGSGVADVLTVDVTYRTAMKAFLRWVEVEAGVPDLHEKWVSNSNVSMYFNAVVQKMTCAPPQARKHFLALKKLREFEDNVMEDTSFETVTIKACLKEQRKSYAVHLGKNIGALTDPYSKLPTNVITCEDTIIAMRYLLSHDDPRWGEISNCWCWGTQAFVRNHSMTVILIKDILWDKKHGPLADNAVRDGMLALALLGGAFHKDKFPKDHIVGVWDHKYIWCCAANFTVMQLFHLFNTDASNMHFDGTRKDEPLFWRNVKFIRWNKYKESYEAFSKLFEDCRLDSSKVTHMRKSGVDFGGTNGLLAQQLATGTKHTGPGSSKLQDAYMPELLPELCLVMSGHQKNEVYRVPRRFLLRMMETPWDNQDIALSLFPSLKRWKEEIVAPGGDNHGKTFISNLIENICPMILYNGIFWYKEFPRHSVSQLLCQRLEGFAEFTKRAHRILEEKSDMLVESKLEALGESTRLSYKCIQEKIEINRAAIGDSFAYNTTEFRELKKAYQEVKKQNAEISAKLGNIIKWQGLADYSWDIDHPAETEEAEKRKAADAALKKAQAQAKLAADEAQQAADEAKRLAREAQRLRDTKRLSSLLSTHVDTAIDITDSPPPDSTTRRKYVEIKRKPPMEPSDPRNEDITQAPYYRRTAFTMLNSEPIGPPTTGKLWWTFFHN